jgi:hypothetical protein
MTLELITVSMMKIQALKDMTSYRLVKSRGFRGSFLPPSSEYSKVVCKFRVGLHMLVNQQESLEACRKARNIGGTV